MGFFSQRYILHCCLVCITKKNNYLAKITKCDEALMVKNIGGINIFKEKIEKGELFEKDISLYERS